MSAQGAVRDVGLGHTPLFGKQSVRAKQIVVAVCVIAAWQIYGMILDSIILPPPSKISRTRSPNCAAKSPR